MAEPRGTADAGARRAAVGAAGESRLLTQVLDAVRSGDIEGAQGLIEAAGDVTLNVGQVFRLYLAELETQSQQLAESQLRTEQALDWFTQLYRTLPVPALLVDGQGLITDANARALDDLDLHRALHTLPVPLRRLMADTDSEVRLAALWPRVLSHPGEAGAGLDDLALRTLEGRLRWADLRVTLLPPREGSSSQLVLCVLADHTARVQAQRAQDMAAAAEHQRDLAQSASLAKTQLLSRVSHELRTPLNAVLGFAQLLLIDPTRLDALGRRQVGMIREAGQHLLELVEEVLQINRAEGGHLSMNIEAVDLAGAAAEVIALLQPMADQAGVSVGFDVAGTESETGGGDDAGPPLLARADKRRLQEALTNLVTNAIKYNRQGGWVRVRAEGDPLNVRLEVQDNGIGMDGEQLAHLFEPFNRLGADRLGVSGYGLGLSIARSMAHAMGGALRAESRPGLGSRFVLELPRAAPDTSAAPLTP